MVPEKSKSKHTAAGQYLGYGLQTVRFCHHLLSAKDEDSVSIELIDDIGYHGEDGSLVYEQNKSALKGNPISNWAEDLWKTLTVWLDGIANDEIDASSAKFRMYVTPSKKGKYASLLDLAVDEQDISAAVELIGAELEKRTNPPACKPFVERFLSAPPDHLHCLIANLTVISSDDDPIQSIRDQLQYAVNSEQIDEAAAAIVGLAKERSDRLIRQGKASIINAGEFKTVVRNFLARYHLPGYLKSLASDPTSTEIGAVHLARPIFIRQLELIAIDGDEQLRAVSDFLRSSADRTEWSDQGLISLEDTRDWDKALLRQHAMARGEIEDMYGDKVPEVRGRLVYRRCNTWKGLLAGQAVPEHFVHGSLNELADCRQLGWHPNFEFELAQNEAA